MPFTTADAAAERRTSTMIAGLVWDPVTRLLQKYFQKTNGLIQSVNSNREE